MSRYLVHQMSGTKRESLADGRLTLSLREMQRNSEDAIVDVNMSATNLCVLGDRGATEVDPKVRPQNTGVVQLTESITVHLSNVDEPIQCYERRGEGVTPSPILCVFEHFSLALPLHWLMSHIVGLLYRFSDDFDTVPIQREIPILRVLHTHKKICLTRFMPNNETSIRK